MSIKDLKRENLRAKQHILGLSLSNICLFGHWQWPSHNLTTDKTDLLSLLMIFLNFNLAADKYKSAYLVFDNFGR
jgi:hypothetical protein